MFSTKLYVNTERNNILTLRITNNRKKSELSLGIMLTPEQFDDAMSSRPKPQNARYRSLLLSLLSKIEEVKCELIESGRAGADVKVIREIIMHDCLGKDVHANSSNSDNKGAFVSWFQSFIDGKINMGTKGVYSHTLNRIRLFDADVDAKDFEDIDIKWLTAFEAYCAKTACKNARNIHLRNIRAVFNNAIDNEVTTSYPFRRFKIRPEATRKRSLSVEELRRLFSFHVEPYAQIYLDMFKLIFMLIGINAVDLSRLAEVTSDGRIEYSRAKTHRRYSIKVEPEALEIIEKYKGVKGLLCIADRWSDHRNFTHQCNKALQRIGKVKRVGLGGKKIIEPEWPELTLYWARHSWATIAYELGISKDIIGQALGHSDDSHSTTNIYIREDDRLVDEANRRVLDWVLYGKR